MAAGALLGVLLGTLGGDLWQQESAGGVVVATRLCGTVFLSILKALIVPLIATSIVVAVLEIGARGRVGRLLTTTALYFLLTTLVAVLSGIFLVSVIHPGSPAVDGPTEARVEPAGVPAQAPLEAVASLIQGLFPDNLFQAAAENRVLGLIVFSLLFGAAAARMGERARPLADALGVANEALFQLVRWVVWLAPLGILGLVANQLGEQGGGAAAWQALLGLGRYTLTVLLGLALHALVTLPLLLWLLARRSPRRYAAGMSEALVTAFGTASSAATLAVSLRGAVERNGVSRRSAEFVLPIGATVNMDGTALYEAVAVVFIAQTLGIVLAPMQLVLVALTATLAAIGAAAIPQAGLVTMVLVLEAVDLPAEAAALIYSIDWILDRFRTAVNVWGDSIGAAIVDRRMTDPA